MLSTDPLIDISRLGIGFTTRAGEIVPVLRGIDLTVGKGETLGLVGESGSGKSTLVLAAMGYLKPGLVVLGGEARFAGQSMFGPDTQQLRGGRLALIPQNAGQALTPTMRIGAQISEALRLHTQLPASARAGRVVDLLARVRLPTPAALTSRYPHELSGGQQQRVAIAMALAGEPEALLLDEPTTGLDVTTQAHVLDLLRDLAAETGTAMVYVSHDLGAVARVCARIAVLYAGEIVAEGTARQILRTPAHPYARGLITAIPSLGAARLPVPLQGRPPAPGSAGSGCAFAPRCILAEDACRIGVIALVAVPSGGIARCRRAGQAAIVPLQPEGVRRVDADTAASPTLSVERLAVSYTRPTLLDQLLARPAGGVAVVDGVTLELRAGETMGLVGESGSGKSTILKAVAGLIPMVGGALRLSGAVLAPNVAQRARDTLRRIQLIFQNPDESLNPRHTVAEILAQPLRLYFGLTGAALRLRATELLDQMRLGPQYLDRLPAQLSGGEKQRVAIARAFAADPDVILCDEVTSALDVSVQAAILALLDALRRDRQVACLFVSHDLGVVRALADRVVVLYQGRICEAGPAAAVYAMPAHPYTEALLGAVLEPDPDYVPRLLAADIVEHGPPARGCAFQKRCHRRIGPICDSETPPVQTAAQGHLIRCHIPPAALLAAQSDA